MSRAASSPTEVKNTYRCRCMDEAPLGAAGWHLSGLAESDEYCESRFMPYDEKAAERLVADVNVDRPAQSAGGDKPQRDTSFGMVYDARGWHIYIRCSEPNVDRILDRGEKAGSLEMAFQPGDEGGGYYQWLIDLARGTVNVVDWDSPHRHYRSLAGALTAETIALDGAFGTRVFIPWWALYDKLPAGDEAWPFSIIRWMPGGGVTWGGKVHEIGNWGVVEWEAPADAQRLAILKKIVARAWGSYAQVREELSPLWSDTVVGDPEFHRKVLAPAIARLDARGAGLDGPADVTIDALFRDAVPEWMEFGYVVDELRRTYLEDSMFRV